MHDGYYEHAYEEYYFHRWITWHEEMIRRECKALNRQHSASLAYDRSRAVHYTRPRMRKRAHSGFAGASVTVDVSE